MSASVLVGRSLEQAGALAEQIAQRDIAAIYQPLLEIETLPAPKGLSERLMHVQAVVLTSANAVAPLAEATLKRDMALLTVGDGTAGAARALGFADVTSADGDAVALLALCRERLQKQRGAVLYLRGRDVASDLAAALAADGYDVESMIVYATQPTRRFDAAVERKIRAAGVDAALLFSPRGAANFVSLARQAGLDRACAAMTLIAFSPAIAAAASDLVWRRQLVTEKPTIPALLATLEQWRDGRFAG